MSEHQPHHDLLAAYLEGMLSADAKRSMEQHLGKCELCREALHAERELTCKLDGLAAIQLPSDFANAVMGRVAQQPAHRPAAPIPWRSAIRWSVAAAAAGTVVFAGLAAWLVASGTLADAQPGSWVAFGIGRIVAAGTWLVASLGVMARQVRAVVEMGGDMLLALSAIAVRAGWPVQLVLLLLTVSLNYGFTRLVMNYQRRE